MREYLFRGRDKNVRWHYGLPMHGVYEKTTTQIQSFEVEPDEFYVHEVDPETVGQFTGLTDKNGRKIFEGDIINFSNPRPFKDFVAEVAFDDGCFYLVNKSRYFRDYLKCYTCNHVGEVIGNRWDNPELLEGAS